MPCNNTGVAILHVMNADGSDMHPISVNNVNEFDPAVLPDGRILFGRWEYVDKNALTIQSLWTVSPDGSNETALFANNMVFPEAILDARPVPGSHWVLGTLAKHNAPPRGSIAIIDPSRGKNNPAAITNLEHPAPANPASRPPTTRASSTRACSSTPTGRHRRVGNTTHWCFVRGPSGAGRAMRPSMCPRPLHPPAPTALHATPASVRAVSRRGVEGPATEPVECVATIVRQPVLAAPFEHDLRATGHDGTVLPGTAHGKARATARHWTCRPAVTSPTRTVRTSS